MVSDVTQLLDVPDPERQVWGTGRWSDALENGRGGSEASSDRLGRFYIQRRCVAHARRGEPDLARQTVPVG